MQKAKQILNILMGSLTGVFIAYGIYVIWNMKIHPEVYAMQSAPWYTSILLYGVVTLIVLIACLLLKVMLKHFARK